MGQVFQRELDNTLLYFVSLYMSHSTSRLFLVCSSSGKGSSCGKVGIIYLDHVAPLGKETGDGEVGEGSVNYLNFPLEPQEEQ